jgi:two-component system chemotaxis sensor kinase CheA
MDELIEDFLVETKEGLESLDNDLVTLEANPTDKEIIGKIFRIMHTIKGTCGFLGFGRLEKVAHAGEDIFDNIRDGKLAVNSQIISMAFQALDKIKSLVEYIEKNESEPAGDDKELIDKLHQCADGNVGEAAPAAAAPKELPPLPPLPPSPLDKKPAEAEMPAYDSPDLQALFDATPSLVDVAPTAEKKEEAKSGMPEYDSADLQALFDATPSLVDVSQPKPEAAPPPPPAPKAEEHKEPAAKKSGSSSSQTIRVSLDVLEMLMQQASELVLTRNQLMQILRTTQNSDFTTPLQRLSAITTELQEGVMKTRMQPIGNAWTKLPRIVRDLSMELGKKIDLIMEGEDTELDRQLLEQITDPLTHMVRNSADHGLEKPEKRLAAGKPETGKIELKAYHGGGYINIEISDDGNGINPDIIKKKAIEKGLVSETDANAMSSAQILRFIFAAGFSTAEQITSVSGRGVGMDVVKNNIESISGTVDLQSTVGKGSVFTIKIPLTLAIMPILQVAVKGHKFAIPQINVMEVVKAGENSGFIIESLNDKPILRIRDKLLPLVSLSEVLQLGDLNDNDKKISNFIVVCEIGSYHFGVIVEEVFDTEEIVVKPVSPMLKSIDVYSGSTILGDGSVILILDPNGLARATGEFNSSGDKKETNADMDAALKSENASFIIFRSGDATPKVVPLELISRLEEIEVEKIEFSRGTPVIQYRDDLMRLVQIDPEYKLPESGIQQLLVLSRNNKIMGLMVEEILDIAKCPISQDISSNKDGFMGSMVINGKTCDVVDVNYYFDQTFGEMVDDVKSSEMAVSSNNTILLVDDSPFFRKFIPPELRQAGYNVITFSNAKDALAKMEAGEKFIAVITDISMPVMDGNEFTTICKANPKFKDIPFIALSSHVDDAADSSNAITAQFDACVSKTNHKELTNVLSSVLAREKVA